MAEDRDRALRVAALLCGNTDDVADRVAAAVRLLADWSTDEQVRAALRPVFSAAVPDQRALIALGDIDAWLRDGRIARGWWESAAAGPDPALAAEAAWKVGRAHRRAGRRDAAAPFLRRAAEGGWTEEAEARRRAALAQVAEDAARREEDRLGLAQRCLDADDPDGTQVLLDSLERPEPRLGGPRVREWERDLRGELAFRRGDLDEAEDHFAAGGGPEFRRRALRLAQIAVLRGDARGAYERTVGLTDDDEVTEEARPLLVLHAELIAAGLPTDYAPVCVRGCCCEAECQGWCDGE